MNKTTYHAYLLRLWTVDDFGRKSTRAALVDVHNGTEHRFTSLETLAAFLSGVDIPTRAATPATRNQSDVYDDSGT